MDSYKNHSKRVGTKPGLFVFKWGSIQVVSVASGCYTTRPSLCFFFHAWNSINYLHIKNKTKQTNVQSDGDNKRSCVTRSTQGLTQRELFKSTILHIVLYKGEKGEAKHLSKMEYQPG